MNILIAVLRKLFCLKDETSDEQTYYNSQQTPATIPKRYVPFSDDLSAWGSVRQSTYGSLSSVGQRYSTTHNSAALSFPELKVDIGPLYGYTAGSVTGSHHSYTSASGLPALGSMYVSRDRRAHYPNVAHVGSYFG
jgi:hypothetical protein